MGRILRRRKEVEPKEGRARESGMLARLATAYKIHWAYICAGDRTISRTLEARSTDDETRAKAYDSATSLLAVHRPVTRWASAMLPPREQDATLVDFGSASARLLIIMARAMRKLRITGSELSPEMLRLAQENIKHAITAGQISEAQVDVARADFLTDRFTAIGEADLATSIQMAHHLPDIQSVADMLKVMHDAIKKDGKGKAKGSILVLDYLRPPTEELVDMLVLRYTGSAEIKEDYRASLKAAFTLTEWRGILALAGIRDLRIAVMEPNHLRVVVYLLGKDAIEVPLRRNELPPYPEEVGLLEKIQLIVAESVLNEGFADRFLEDIYDK